MTDVNASVLIRAPRLTDAAVVAALSNELGYPTTAQQMRARLTMLESLPMHIVLVAELAERVVGWVHAEHGLSGIWRTRRVAGVGSGSQCAPQWYGTFVGAVH